MAVRDVILKTSEICGFIITNHCLILYPILLFTKLHIHKIHMYCSNVQLNDRNKYGCNANIKELHEIISTMPVGKASG